MGPHPPRREPTQPSQTADPSQPSAPLQKWLLLALWPFLHSDKYVAYLRSFSKWYFDLITSAILVAALLYFAKKTKSEILYQIASFSKLIFTLYCYSYLFWWEAPLRAKAKTRLQRDLIGYVVMPVSVALIYVMFTKFLNVLMRELLVAQSR